VRGQGPLYFAALRVAANGEVSGVLLTLPAMENPGIMGLGRWGVDLGNRQGIFRRLFMKSCFTLIAICCCFVGGELLHADEVRTVMLSGQPAPGTSGQFGNNLFDFGLNNAGQVAFRSTIYGPGIDSTNSFGIWSDVSGSLQLVARTSSQAPGMMSGASFEGLGHLMFNDAGQIAFDAELIGTGIASTNNEGVWSNRDGSLAPIFVEGQQAPGTGAGVNFSNSIVVPLFNSQGQLSFYHYLTGTGVTGFNRLGIWSEGSGELSLVARNGSPDPATGDPFGMTNYDFEGMDFNDLGQTAFTEGLGVGLGAGKIWLDDAGSVSLVARSGGSAPGMGAGVNFTGLWGPSLNDVGDVVFRGSMSGLGVTSNNNVGIWSGENGNLSLRVRTGMQAPGLPAGVTFSELAEYPIINDAGQLAITGRVTGSGITSSNNTGIWSDASGSLSLIARIGDPAPGLGPNLRFKEQYFISPQLNNSGQAAFYAQLVDAAAPTVNIGSIWAQDTDGVLQLIARTGTQMDVDDGPGVDLRTINALYFNSINDVGQVAFAAHFAGGLQGFFVSNAVSSADFDRDGDVDGRDLLVWQRGGSPAPWSAGNLALWQEQYAAANGGLTVAVQVPEPGAIGMLLVVSIAAIAPLRCDSSRG
jgi:hypothetical protein